MGSQTPGAPSPADDRSEKRVSWDGRGTSSLINGTEWLSV